MQNGRIKNRQISASSIFDKNHAAWLGRLNRKKVGHYRGAWAVRHSTRYQWLKVDFGRPTRIVQILTQGRQDYRQWVTQYYVTYSQDGIHWAEYKINSGRKVMLNDIHVEHAVLINMVALQYKLKLYRPLLCRWSKRQISNWSSVGYLKRGWLLSSTSD